LKNEGLYSREVVQAEAQGEEEEVNLVEVLPEA